MSNKMIAILVLAVLVMGGYLYTTQKQYSPSASNQQPSAYSQPTTPRAQPTATPTSTKESTATMTPTGEVVKNNTNSENITIKDFSFSPGTLTIKKGTTVSWVNQDSATHTIKSDEFNSPDLKTGDKFEFTFKTAGSFAYTCGIHPSMTGKIVVQ